MYRVMVQSTEGHVQIGNAYKRRLVWSTWTREDSPADAWATAASLVASGSLVQVITDDEYANFCLKHEVF